MTVYYFRTVSDDIRMNTCFSAQRCYHRSTTTGTLLLEVPCPGVGAAIAERTTPSNELSRASGCYTPAISTSIRLMHYDVQNSGARDSNPQPVDSRGVYLPN